MSKGTLGEMMGKGEASKGSQEISLKNLRDFLGDGMPEIKFNPLGRVRLIKALKQRFGEGFRAIPGVSKTLKAFDNESSFDLKVREMKKITIKE